MQEVRLWEVIDEDTLREIPSSQIAFEERLEDWLSKDISFLDPNLLIIGREVRTDFGQAMDLLCLDNVGDTVIVELKRGQTPRDTAAQALEYASWVKDLSHDRIVEIADRHFKNADSLRTAFEERFETKLPDELNLGHRILVVAESIDASTDRIVRYLSDMNVPINVATVQHFTDSDGRRLLAQVFLVEPEKAEAKARASSKRRRYRTVNELQELAEENGIGELYSHIRSGVRGVLSANGYTTEVAYTLRRKEGGVRTVLFISAMPHKEHGGLRFTVHATRLVNQLGVDVDHLQTYLPPNLVKEDASGWVGSSPEERRHAVGLSGTFHSTGEIDTFLNALKSAIADRPSA